MCPGWCTSISGIAESGYLVLESGIGVGQFSFFSENFDLLQCALFLVHKSSRFNEIIFNFGALVHELIFEFAKFPFRES